MLGMGHTNIFQGNHVCRDEPTDSFDIFISFSASDSHVSLFGKPTDLVPSIKKQLEIYRHPTSNNKLRVCTYIEDFEFAPAVEDAIRSMLDASSAVILICSQGASESSYVKFEVQHTINTKGIDCLIPCIVDSPVAVLFPEVFSASTMAANLSFSDLPNRQAWRKRIEIECAKIAAQVWGVRLIEVYDRFLTERQRRRNQVIFAAGVASFLVLIGAGAAAFNYLEAVGARELAAARRFSAGIASVERAWYSAGDFTQANRLLERLRAETNNDKALPFEWRFLRQSVSAPEYDIGEQASPVHTLAVAPQGAATAAGFMDHPVRLFDALDGGLIADLSPETVGARSVQFIGQEQLMIALPGKIIIWDKEIGDETSIPIPDGLDSTSICIRPDGKSGVGISEGGNFYSIDIPNRQVKLLRSTITQDIANSLEGDLCRFSSNGRFLVVFKNERGIDVFDGSDFRHINHLPIPDLQVGNSSSVRVPALFGNFALFTTKDRIGVADFEANTVRFSEFIGNAVTALDVSSDLKQLLVGGSWRSVELWQMPKIEEPHTWSFLEAFRPISGWVSSAQFVPNSELIVVSSLGGSLTAWDIDSIAVESLQFASDIAEITALLVMPDDDIIVGDRLGGVRRVSAVSGTVVWERQFESSQRHYSPIEGLAIIGAPARVAVADPNGEVRILDPLNGNDLDRFPGWAPFAHSSRSFAYQIEGDAKIMLLSFGENQRRTEISLAEHHMTEEVDDYVISLAMSHSGRWMAAGTTGGRVILIDARTGHVEASRKISDEILSSITFSPDGETIAAGGSDVIHVLGSMNLAGMASLTGHWEPVVGLAFSPDGQTLVSGGRDNVLRFWSANAWQETMTLSRFAGDINPNTLPIVFNANGARLMTGGADGRLVIWRAPPPEN